MTKQITVNGPTITRNDGSVVHPTVYRDANGDLLGKAYIPEGETVAVPDEVADYVVIEADTNLPDHVPDSAIGDTPDPASTAMEKLEKLDVPTDGPM